MRKVSLPLSSAVMSSDDPRNDRGDESDDPTGLDTDHDLPTRVSTGGGDSTQAGGADEPNTVTEHPADESDPRTGSDAPTMLPSDTPTMATEAGGTGEAAADSPGDTIDHYRILEVLGEGGMGIVYKAEQTEPVQRNVALKIIKLGMDTKDVVTRFQAERQALAVMDHPSIASVYDAGATRRGRPYFVMELVTGTPITKFCDSEVLTTKQRLNLFIQVCRAVQHAHQKGVIHRDLKPSNIMISEHDGEPLPKVIDFGIAKATQQEDSDDENLVTQMGQMLGTPEYMSPEQAELSGKNVDTRTDVYSLGVVLYELITGTIPFNTRDLRKGLSEMQRIIQHTTAPTPSKRVTMLAHHSDAIARRRNTDIRGLTRQLHGDLDWIVMKALEKDPARRYATVNAMANDVMAFLSNEIVEARPPSTTYRMQKFVSRHLIPVLFSAALIVALIAGVIGTGVGFVNSRREALKANAINTFLQDMLIAVNPENARGREVTVRDVLDEASSTVGASFENQPEVEASLRHTIGTMYQRLGLYVEAEPHFLRAIELFEQLEGDEDVETLESLNQLAINYFRQRRSEAEEMFRRVTEASTRLKGPDDPEYTLTGMHNLAAIYLQSKRYDEAEPLLVQVVDARRRVLGPDHRQTTASVSNLASLYKETGRLDQAQELFREVRDIRVTEFGPDHPRTLVAAFNLADTYRNNGRLEEAEPIYVATLTEMRRVLGDSHPYTLEALAGLTALLLDRGRPQEAQPMAVENLVRREERYGVDHGDTLPAYVLRARTHFALGEHPQALVLFDRALRVGHESPLESAMLLALTGRIEAKLALERLEGLEAEARRNVDLHADKHGQDHEQTEAARDLLAQVTRLVKDRP